MVSKEKVLDFIERNSDKYTFYLNSIKIKDGNAFLIGKDDLRKYLSGTGPAISKRDKQGRKKLEGCDK